MNIDNKITISNNTRKLNEIKRLVTILESNMNYFISKSSFTTLKKEYFRKKLHQLLHKVAELSLRITEMRDEIYEFFSKSNNKKTLVNQKFQVHYKELHNPYDKIKNKIWELIDVTYDNKMDL